MIKVFCIDGVNEPHYELWHETPQLNEEWEDRESYIFKQIQKWCSTDMAVMLHSFREIGHHPEETWQVIFWGDEDARLKPNMFCTMKWHSDKGSVSFMNRIVAVAQDGFGKLISIGPDAELKITNSIASRVYQFPIFPLRVPSNG